MADLGLSEAELAQLLSVFSHYPQITNAVVYGSRAKGNYSGTSDIDLALDGEELDRHILARIALDLDDSNLVYQVDLLDLKDLKNPLLRDHIERVGVSIYERSS